MYEQYYHFVCIEPPKGVVVCHTTSFRVVTDSDDVVHVCQCCDDPPVAASASWQLGIREEVFFVSTFSTLSVLQQSGLPTRQLPCSLGASPSWSASGFPSSPPLPVKFHPSPAPEDTGGIAELCSQSSCISSPSETRSWSFLTIVEWGRSSSISSCSRPYDRCPRSLSSISIASLPLAPWWEEDLLPTSPWPDDCARGDMFLEGTAEQHSCGNFRSVRGSLHKLQ